MKFIETSVQGAVVIKSQPRSDERGYFARAWCQNELRDAGLNGNIKQSNIGFSHTKGTLRGLHLQRPPYEEVKIVRCFRGAMFDVVVDLRPQSPTYLDWFGIELSEDNLLALYVPEGCATGYLTLTADCMMEYHASEVYDPDSAYGVRWDDTAFGIEWPNEPVLMSNQDRQWPYLER